MAPRDWRAGLRRRCYEILERGSVGDRTSLLVDRLLEILLIIVNLVSVALEFDTELASSYGVWFEAIELVSLVVFTLEYGLRIWVAVEHRPYRHQSAWRGRWNYLKSAAGIVDLLAVLPFWFALLFPADLRAILVVRAIRFLKMHILAGHALAARSTLSGAPRAVRLRRNPDGRHVHRRIVDASGRGTGAARQVRHRSRCHVVGDRHARHHRLRRRGAGDSGGQAHRRGDDLHGPDHRGAAGRHHCERVRRRDPPPRFRRHLGNGGAGTTIFRARCR